jgi:hypothetical protein
MLGAIGVIDDQSVEDFVQGAIAADRYNPFASGCRGFACKLRRMISRGSHHDIRRRQRTHVLFKLGLDLRPSARAAPLLA